MNQKYLHKMIAMPKSTVGPLLEARAVFTKRMGFEPSMPDLICFLATQFLNSIPAEERNAVTASNFTTKLGNAGTEKAALRAAATLEGELPWP